MKVVLAIALSAILLPASLAQTNLLALHVSASTRTATSSVPGTNEITFREFTAWVAAANVDYAAQRYSVSISVAEAAVAAAREFQNPSQQLSGGRDLTHSGGQLWDVEFSSLKGGNNE